MYFEDFKPGDRFVSQDVTLSESMIIGFVLTYDPQPFYLDSQAAAALPFGAVIARGLQTLPLGFRLFVQLGLFSARGMGSPGVDELRWLRPVRPGHTVHSGVEVIDARPSNSKLHRRTLLMAFTIRNQRDEDALTMRTIQLSRRHRGPRATKLSHV